MTWQRRRGRSPRRSAWAVTCSTSCACGDRRATAAPAFKDILPTTPNWCLSPDVILSTGTAPEEDYPSVRTFAESGARSGLPGTCRGTRSSRDRERERQHCTARLAAEHGGEGFLNTDQRPRHYRRFTVVRLLTAASRPDGRTDPRRRLTAPWAAFFGPRGGDRRAVRALGRLNARGMPPATPATRCTCSGGAVLAKRRLASLRRLAEVERVSREAEATLRSARGAPITPKTPRTWPFRAPDGVCGAKARLPGAAGRVRALRAGQGERRRPPGGLRSAPRDRVGGAHRALREVRLARARHSEIGISRTERAAGATGPRGEWVAERLEEARRGDAPPGPRGL